MNVSLSELEDDCRWLLTKDGKFTVKSMYNMLKTQQVHCSYKEF
jgi:hypothetical protein